MFIFTGLPEGESAAAASGAGLWQIFPGKVRYDLTSIFGEKVQLFYRQSVMWECNVKYVLSSIFVEKLQLHFKRQSVIWERKVRYGLSSKFIKKVHPFYYRQSFSLPNVDEQ